MKTPILIRNSEPRAIVAPKFCSSAKMLNYNCMMGEGDVCSCVSALDRAYEQGMRFEDEGGLMKVLNNLGVPCFEGVRIVDGLYEVDLPDYREVRQCQDKATIGTNLSCAFKNDETGDCRCVKFFRILEDEEKKCEQCGGTGFAGPSPEEEFPCTHCDGNGIEPKIESQTELWEELWEIKESHGHFHHSIILKAFQKQFTITRK